MRNFNINPVTAVGYLIKSEVVKKLFNNYLLTILIHITYEEINITLQIAAF